MLEDAQYLSVTQLAIKHQFGPYLFNSMPHLKSNNCTFLIGIPDIIFCTYVYTCNYVNIYFTLKRTICEISLCTKYVILFK